MRTIIIIITLVSVVPVVLEAHILPVFTSLSAVTAAGCLVRIPDAVSTVRQERRRTAAEETAFERFADEIEEMNPSKNSKPQPVAVGYNNDLPRPSGVPTSSARVLFEETVMDTDHYSEEYDDTPLESISAELGTEFATVIISNENIIPPVQQAFAQAGRAAAQQRAEFLCKLDAELESISGAEQELNSLLALTEEVRTGAFDRYSFDYLAELQNRLDTGLSRCETIIESRQTDYITTPKIEEVDLREYLYRQYEWTHPVVGDTLDVIRDIREANHKIIEYITYQS